MMKPREIQMNLIAGILIVSLLYHTGDYLALIVAIPLAFVSIGVNLDKGWVKILGLIASTISAILLIQTYSMSDLYVLSIFIFTFIAPLNVYWYVVLSPRSSFDTISGAKGVSYMILVLAIFYATIFVLNIDSYLLSIGNLAPQALLLTALTAILFIPYHILSEKKD